MNRNKVILIRYMIILIMAIKLITININGLNCEKKQQMLFDHIQQNDFSIINIQFEKSR